MQMPQPAVPSYGHLRLWISSHRLALKTHNFTVEINMFTATNISKSLKFFVWILFMCKLWPVQGYQSKSKLKPPTIESNAVPYEDHTQSSQCTAHTHTNSVTCSCYKDFHKSEASVSLLPPALLGSFTAPLPVLPDSLSAPPPHRCWPPPQGFCLHLQLPAWPPESFALLQRLPVRTPEGLCLCMQLSAQPSAAFTTPVCLLILWVIQVSYLNTEHRRRSR